MPDAGLRFKEIRGKKESGGLSLSCNIRPWIEGYLEDDRLAIASNWERFEGASRHFFKFEVRRDARDTYENSAERLKWILMLFMHIASVHMYK